MSDPFRVVDSQDTERAVWMIGRACIAVSAVAAAIGAVLLAWLPASLPALHRWPLMAALASFTLACAWCWQRSATRPFPMRAAHTALAAVAMPIAAAVGVALGDGVRDPALGACALTVCVITALLGWRIGLGLGVLSVALTGGLAWLEATSSLMPSADPARMPLMLALQWVLIASAFASGSLIARVVERYLESAAKRERHIRALLRMAADWYWVQDHNFRYTLIAGAAPGGEHLMTEHLGLTAWEVPGAGMSEARLDKHRADLEARRPFANLLTRRVDAHGRTRLHSVTGEPQFDAGGVFVGYWGVARDVTEEIRAQRSVAASETRYRELFERSPSSLFLSRRGVVFEVNEAAAKLFGRGAREELHGMSMVSIFMDDHSRARIATSLARLETLAVGEGIPVSDFTAMAADGRAISVQATAVRVETSDGLATLWIIVDTSARQAAEAALRRSEAMLSHLFQTSPDCITVTELPTGRHTMVNPAFTRVTGYESVEVIGRTPTELGLWHDLAERDRMRAAIQRDGVVLDMPATIRTRTGALAQVLLAAARFEMDGRDYTVVNARDVTLTQRTQLEHTAILSRASIGIAFTRYGCFIEANPCFEAIFGWPAGALVGEPEAVVAIDVAEHPSMCELAATFLTQGKSFETEREMKRRDGTRFWCRLLAQVIDPLHPSDGGTIWIADDVTERRRIEQALAAARDAAEHANQAKSAFLANTSHEIRTPLNGLLGLARIAMQDSVSDAKRQSYVKRIFDTAQGLEGILSDILDLSKIEAGKITIESVTFDLHELLGAVQLTYQSLADAKGLTLELVMGSDVPQRVEGDPGRIRQILSNYITNAVKFTERGRVRLEAGGGTVGSVRIAVLDSGVGIAVEAQQKLWEPFSQGDTSTTRRYGGTGLGLSICRELAVLMGGRVGMHSQAGAGSTFWVELPLGSRASADPVEGDPDALWGKRVLLVEDNAVNMMIAAATLERWGLRVAQAADGFAAIDAVDAAVAQGEPFDAVVMDVQMPELSGHQTTAALRQRFDSRVLPIIALTAAALASEREQALASGMNDFLTKPIDAPKLRRALARCLREAPSASAL